MENLPQSSTIVIALECAYLIEKSTSVKVVLARCKLLRKSFEDIKAFRGNNFFIGEYNQGLVHYQNIYPDRSITEIQSAVLSLADEGYLNKLFFIHMERSLYIHIDTEIANANKLKIDKEKWDRHSTLHDESARYIQDIGSLFYETDIEAIPKTGRLRQVLYNYIQLKTNFFDDKVITVVDGKHYKDENKPTMHPAARKLIKELKSKLWVLDYYMMSKDYIIKLLVNGSNVGLSLGDKEKSDDEFLTKIKTLFANDNEFKTE